MIGQQLGVGAVAQALQERGRTFDVSEQKSQRGRGKSLRCSERVPPTSEYCPDCNLVRSCHTEP